MSARKSTRPTAGCRPLFAALVATIAFAIGGCSTDGSLTPRSGDDPEFAPTPLAPSDRVGAPPLQVTKRIKPLLGGVIVCGRHTLIVPPGAILKETDITVRDTSTKTGVVEAQLFPEGLHFIVPVTLSMTIGTEPNAASGYSIFWYDPTGGLLSWVNLGGLLSQDGRSVSTTLLHFSTYRAGTLSGKAGW